MALTCRWRSRPQHQEQVRRFAGSLPGDTYVFIVFEWKTYQIVTKIWTNNLPKPLCLACCDRARRGEISPDNIRPAAVTLQGDASGDIVHLCETCFEANCKGGMEEGDAVTFQRDVSLSTDDEHSGHDDVRKPPTRN